MKYMIYILLMIGMLGYACSDDKDIFYLLIQFLIE